MKSITSIRMKPLLAGLFEVGGLLAELHGATKPTLDVVPYGPHERQVLDFYRDKQFDKFLASREKIPPTPRTSASP